MSYDINNVFAKILRGEIPCTKVFEDQHVLAFNDINPKAPIHILVIPKRAYTCFEDFTKNAPDLEISAYFKSLSTLIETLKIPSGYRLVMNKGPHSGQIVFHFHTHILAGKPLGELVCA